MEKIQRKKVSLYKKAMEVRTQRTHTEVGSMTASICLAAAEEELPAEV